MPRIVITHGVTDVDTWLQGKAERAEALGGLGGSNVVDHVAQDGSPAVALTADVDDVDRLMETIAAPPAELADAMARHGVQPPLTIYVER